MRLLVLLTASVIATAAPVRAWCEASCLAAAHQEDAAAKPHCPTSEPAGDDAKMSAANLDDCPVVEAARPITFAKLDFADAPVVVSARGTTPALPRAGTPGHLGTPALRHPGFIPLRI